MCECDRMMVVMCWRRLDGGASARAHPLRRPSIRVSSLPQGVQDKRVSLAPREPQQDVRPRRPTAAHTGTRRRSAQARPETRPSRRRRASSSDAAIRRRRPWTADGRQQRLCRLRSHFSGRRQRCRQLGVGFRSVYRVAAERFRSAVNVYVDLRLHPDDQ